MFLFRITLKKFKLIRCQIFKVRETQGTVVSDVVGAHVDEHPSDPRGLSLRLAVHVRYRLTSRCLNSSNWELL